MFMTTLISAICLIGFLIFNHPLLLVSLLVVQTSLLFLLMALITSSSWISYVVFLVIVGGLLVVFIYLSAIIPNEFFGTTKYPFILLPFGLFYLQELNLPKKEIMEMNSPLEFSFFFLSSVLIPILAYLVMTLFVVMCLTSTLKTPLKQKTYVFAKKSPTN